MERDDSKNLNEAFRSQINEKRFHLVPPELCRFDGDFIYYKRRSIDRSKLHSLIVTIARLHRFIMLFPLIGVCFRETGKADFSRNLLNFTEKMKSWSSNIVSGFAGNRFEAEKDRFLT